MVETRSYKQAEPFDYGFLMAKRSRKAFRFKPRNCRISEGFIQKDASPTVRTKKGQVSTELMIIVGIVLLIFIPLLVMVYLKAAEGNEEIGNYHAELTVFRLAYLANSVGSLGEGSIVYSDVYIPRNTKELTIYQIGNVGEINLKLTTPQGETELVEIIKMNIA